MPASSEARSSAGAEAEAGADEAGGFLQGACVLATAHFRMSTHAWGGVFFFFFFFVCLFYSKLNHNHLYNAPVFCTRLRTCQCRPSVRLL